MIATNHSIKQNYGMPALNFHHLRYFHAIAQAGSLTRAAERLNVSPSALSVQVQQLEAQLGQALFERRGRQLVLTEAGRIALDRADAIFAAGDELVDALKGVRTPQVSTLRVGALATLSRNFQVAFLAPLHGRDDVRLVLRSGALRDLLAQLEAHQIDVLLTNTLPTREGKSFWTAHRLADQPISLVGPKPPRGRRMTIEQILSTKGIVAPTSENHIRGDFDSLMQRMGLAPTIIAEVDDMAMIRVLARSGLGYAVAPPIVVRDELDSGLLCDHGSLPGLTESFFAIAPVRRFPNPLVEMLIAAHAPLKADRS